MHALLVITLFQLHKNIQLGKCLLTIESSSVTTEVLMDHLIMLSFRRFTGDFGDFNGATCADRESQDETEKRVCL